VVSATGATPVASSVAQVVVGAPAAPVITISTEPAATTTVTQGAISGNLSVAASVSPSGTPTYQWYSNTTASNSGGTAVAGATSATFPIPAALTAGTYYYYVVVSVAGGPSVASSVATVVVKAAGGPPVPITTATPTPTLSELALALLGLALAGLGLLRSRA
jgi:hypothetical protein